MEDSDEDRSGVISPVVPAVSGGSDVERGGLVGDEVVEVEEESQQKVDKENKDNPWPHVAPFFKFTGRKELKLIYACTLCPGRPEVNAHTTSTQNLKSHINSKHKARLGEFTELLKKKSKRGMHAKKRVHSGESGASSASTSVEAPLPGKRKTQSQSNILEWVGSAALEAGTRKVSQKKIEALLVDIFVENMLALRVSKIHIILLNIK
jgi:hypothetical protein